jgi:ABC-2 type transport system permease protein
MMSLPATTDISAASSRPAPHLAGAGTSRFATCWALYVLSLRQHLHGKRWIALAVLFLLPAGMAIVIRESWAQVPPLFLDFALDWILVPQAILPLIALLYASGIIQDEQEDQTITYLLIRPLPKWLLYVVKMIATWTTTVVLVVVLTLLTYLAIYFRSELDFNYVASRFVKTAAIHSLAVIAYASIFGLVGVLTRPSLVVGVVYTVLIEGVLANLPLSLRMGTVIYYSRIIAYRALDFVVHGPHGDDNDVAATWWFLDTSKDPKLAEHPQLWTCVLTLVIASVVCTVVAASLCSQREFHVKTPEKD